MVARKDNGAAGAFDQARELVARGDVRGGFSLLLETLRLDPLHGEALAAAAQAAKLLGDAHGSGLFEALRTDLENPKRLYDLGYYLVGMGRPDVGRAFLSACLKRDPGNDDVRYELGFSHYLNRSYDEALVALREAAGNLSPSRAAAAEGLIVECLLYSGRRQEAEDILERLRSEATDEGVNQTLNALALMASRLRRLGDRTPEDLRTWHYVQHGGVLLAESRAEDSAGRFRSLSMNPAAVGAVIRLLQYFLHGMAIQPSAILHLGGDSEPLALAAGSVLERPIRRLDNRSGSEELLIVGDPDDIKGHEEVVAERDEVALYFSFRIDPDRPCAIAPDITGIMARGFRFPWQERVEVAGGSDRKLRGFSVPADPRRAEAVAKEIADLARSLPEDRKMAAVLKFYQRHRELLVAADAAAFPWRRMFTPFSPI